MQLDIVTEDGLQAVFRSDLGHVTIIGGLNSLLVHICPTNGPKVMEFIAYSEHPELSGVHFGGSFNCDEALLLAAGLLAAGLLEAQAPERCPECGAEPVGGEAYCWECWCNGFGWPE